MNVLQKVAVGGGMMLAFVSATGGASVDFALELQRGRNAARTEWAPGGEFYGIDARITVSPVGTTNFLHSPNTNHAWRVGPGEFAPDQILPGSGGRLYFTLQEALEEMTNGLWTIVLNEGAPDQAVYRFKIDASGITEETLALPVITFPADDADSVETSPTFTWVLANAVEENEVSLNLANSFYQLLPSAARSWTPPFPLVAGDTEFNLVTRTSAGSAIAVHAPTNSSGGGVGAWSAATKLQTRRTHQFFVGPRIGGSSLIAHLKFEEGGFLGRDSSSMAQHAGSAWIGNPPGQEPDGKDGAALRLIAGDQGELRWESGFVQRLARGFSVSAWIKTTQDFGPGDDDWGAGAGIIGAQACCDGRDFAPLVLNGGYVLFNTGNGQGGGQTLASTEQVNTGEWVHLVATRERASGLMSLYINGQLHDSLQPQINAVLDGPDKLTVGSLGNFNNPFEGLIDDVQVYTNALTAAEVLYLFEHPGETVSGGGPDSLDLGEAVDAPAWAWTTSAEAPWSGQRTMTFDGVDAAQSGVVGEFGESWIETTLEGPGLLEFRWRVESESGVDYLEVTQDGAFIDELSGGSDWQIGQVSLDAGSHVFRWRYYQDDLPGEGAHAAWLDQVTFSGMIAPVMTLQPFDQTNSPGYRVALRAAATGTPAPAWQWFKTGSGPILGATNALYIPTNSGAPSVAGEYYAAASNGAGTTETRRAQVTFLDAAAPPSWTAAFPAPLGHDDLLTPRTNYGIACLVDPSGQVYAANSFTGSNTVAGQSLTAGPGRFGTALIKYSAAGVPLWTRGLTNDGSGNSYPQCLAFAPDQGVYMSGVFLGTNWLGTNRLVETAGASVYVARIDPGGNVLWVRTIQGTNAAFQSYHQLAADAGGNVTVSALIQNTVSLGATNVTVSGQKGILAQFDGGGNLRWIQLPSGWVQSMTPSAGRIYATLAADGSGAIGGLSLSTDRRWILAALNGSNGAGIWLRGFGSEQPQSGFRDVPVVAAAGADVFVAGTAYGPDATFGPLSVPTAGGQYLARYTADGTPERAVGFGSPSTVPWAMVADAAGSVYIGADFELEAAFGSRWLAGEHHDALAEGFPSQALIAKFDRNGAVQWAKMAESPTSYANIRDLAPAGDGVWACGFVREGARFDAFTVTAPAVCLGFPFCSIQYFVGGWVGKITDSTMPPRIVLLDPRRDGANFGFDFSSQAGLVYTVESRDGLGGAGTWNVVTNVTGDGGTKTVLRPLNAPVQRVYRVRTP